MPPVGPQSSTCAAKHAESDYFTTHIFICCTHLLQQHTHSRTHIHTRTHAHTYTHTHTHTRDLVMDWIARVFVHDQFVLCQHGICALMCFNMCVREMFVSVCVCVWVCECACMCVWVVASSCMCEKDRQRRILVHTSGTGGLRQEWRK